MLYGKRLRRNTGGSRRRRFTRRPARRGFRNRFRSKRRGAPSKAIVRQPNIVPDRYFCKLKYVDRYSITSTLGAQGLQQLRGNSLYDIDLTGGGVQPYGYDQISAFYSHYTVFGSAVSLRCTTVGTTSPLQTFDVALVPSVSSTVSTDNDLVSQYPYAQRRVQDMHDTPLTIKAYMSTAQIWGQSKLKVKMDDLYSSLVTGSPSSQWYWTISVMTADLASTSSLIVYLKYKSYAMFYGRVNLAESAI